MRCDWFVQKFGKNLRLQFGEIAREKNSVCNYCGSINNSIYRTLRPSRAKYARRKIIVSKALKTSVIAQCFGFYSLKVSHFLVSHCNYGKQQTSAIQFTQLFVDSTMNLTDYVFVVDSCKTF